MSFCPLGFGNTSAKNESLTSYDRESDTGNSSDDYSASLSKIRPAPHINPAYNGVYKWTFLTVWIVVSLLFVLDRFYTNVWPRQSFSGAPCNAKCGGDYFCGFNSLGREGPPGCLREGPWSAKTFDFLARASARIIITTTNLMFLTVSHTTWNYLSEVRVLKRFLYDWRNDNLWIHKIGGWTMGVWTMAHMWSLFLPSIFHGYRNVHVPGAFSWPAQINLDGPQIDVAQRLARWGSDDVWRIVWLTVILCFLVPYSRSHWGLRKNFSLAMWIHLGAAAGYFIDSFRRKTHPHVWILNTPFVAWYLVDRLISVQWYRVDRAANARRIVLDKNYMVLLWKQNRYPKRICDLYWLRERFESRHRASEWSHPFTVASAHYVQLQDGSLSYEKSMIEAPISTDVHWEGHRFQLMAGAPGKNSTTDAGKQTPPNKRITRMDTTTFNKKRIELTSSSDSPAPWDCIAIMRIHHRDTGNGSSPHGWLGYIREHMCGLFFRNPETANIASKDPEDNPSASVPLTTFGPYRSAYGRLFELPYLPPLILVGTGAGAALVLDVVAHIREHNILLQYPVRVYYSAASLPLLQFVTNTLLAVTIPELTVQTALTRNEELEFEDTEDEAKKGQLRLERFSVNDIVEQAEMVPRAEVYFCGACSINSKLEKLCAKKRLTYVGSSVQ